MRPSECNHATRIETSLRTIVIVDDDPSVSRFVATVLKKMGFNVTEAHNGAAARAMIDGQADPVTLVICDIRMPGGSGLDLAVELEAARPGLPILYISGLVDSVAVRSILLTRPDAILTKPFTASVLIERVYGLIGSAMARPSDGGANNTTHKREPGRQSDDAMPEWKRA